MSSDDHKRYLPRSLYGRAALILLLPVVTIQLVVSVVFIQRLFEDVTEQMTGNVALELAYLTEVVGEAPDAAAAERAATELSEALDIRVTLPDPAPISGDSRRPIDLSGRLILPTLRDALDGVQGIDLASDDKVVDMTVATRHGRLGLEFSRDRVSAQNPHQLLVLMMGTSLLMTLIAYLFLKNQLRPITRLAEAATAFGKGRTLPYRPSGASEVRTAGAAFLDMRNRIERQMEQRTMMLSGISHDLRTPLTRLRLSLSMIDSDETEAMEGDLTDMQRMLDTFLDFARDGTLDDPIEADPATLVDDLIENARRSGQDVRLVRAEGTGTALLRPIAITRALENLVGNAIRYGSRAELSYAISPRAVVFTVEDDGPGIPETVRDDALKPFFRLDAARNQNRGGGVGLGLSIAMDIARQHGGVLRLNHSQRLGGLRADIVVAR